MDKARKSKIKEYSFDVYKRLGALPAAREEVLRALRVAATVNSSAMTFQFIHPAFLQLAIDRTPDRRWEKICSDYSQAMVEAQTMYQAVERVEQLALAKEALTLDFLLAQHRAVFERTRYSIAGKFRSSDDKISSPTGLDLPRSAKLPELIEHHLSWLTHRLQIFGSAKPDSFFEIFHIAAEAQYRLISCMPMDTGNRRFARMISDYVLLYSGLFYNVLDWENREEYCDAVKRSSVESLSPLVHFLIESFGHTLDRINGFIELAECPTDPICIKNIP